MDPIKTKVIKEWPISKSMKDIQLFLGFINFYRKFIYWHLEVVILLSNLIKKERKFEQILEKEEAFLILKDMFIKGLILTMFNIKKKIIIEIDVNKIALGAILNLLNKRNQLYPVTFYTRKFTILKLNYDIYDKELLVIVDSFKVQKVYLKGFKYKMKIYIDYKNLKSFISTKVLNQR